jgi:hypothetical protein
MLVTDMILVTLCCAPQVRHRGSTNPPMAPEAGLLNKSSSFAAAYINNKNCHIKICLK